MKIGGEINLLYDETAKCKAKFVNWETQKQIH
jgi:hypothetical protein